MDLQLQQQSFLGHYRQEGKSENSLKCYRLDFTCFNEYLEHASTHPIKNLHQFNTRMVEEFEVFLGQKYKNINSIRRKLQTLRLFFDFLVQKGDFPDNPIRAIQSAPKVLYPPTLHPIEKIQQAQLHFINKINGAETSKEILQSYRNYVLFLLIYHSGLSVSQLANLKIKDLLNLEDENAEIRILIQSKRRDPYTIPFPNEFRSTLQRYCKILHEEMNLDNFYFEQLFFNSNAYKLISGGISPRGVEDIFHKMCEATKLDITPKSLRQTCALKWIQEEHAPATIKEWMGVAPSYSMNLFLKTFEEKKVLCEKLQNLKNYEPLH